MRCYLVIVAIWACSCTPNAWAQQCVDRLFPPLPAQPSYSGLSTSYVANGALNGWYAVATSFVDALWPDIPYEQTFILVNNTLKVPPVPIGQMASSLFLDWGKAVVALFILGLLLAICVPIVGICVCCCRVFGFCGGNHEWGYTRDRSYKPKRAWCACITLTVITVLLIVIVFAGVVIAYISTANARAAVSETPETVDRSFEDIQTYLATLQRDVEFVALEQYTATADCVVESVDDSFTSVVDGVARDLNVDNALNLADQAVMDIDKVNMLLTNITSSTMQLTMARSTLETSFNSISSSLANIMSDQICDSVCPTTLLFDTSAFDNAVSMVPDITAELTSANTTLHGYDIRNFISSARTGLNSTLSNISVQVERMKQEVSSLLKGTVQDNINSSIGQLTRSLETVVAQIDDIQNDTRYILSLTVALPNGPTTYLNIANETGFALGICFCVILTLILLLAVTGLLLGSSGVLMGGISPPSRNKMADCGGRCLLASSGCIFIWWFLLMVVVTFAFLFGAVLQIPCDEVKHPSYNAFVKTLDDPDALRAFPLPNEFAMLLQMEDLSFREILGECSQNQSLFKATGLDRILLSFGIDLNGLLTNATEMIEELRTDATNSIVSIPVGTVTILSGDVMMDLENIKDFNLQSVNVTEVVDGYSSALTTVDLDTLLDTLQQLQVDCARASNCLVESDINAAISNVTTAQTTMNSITQTVGQLSNDFSSAQGLAVNISNTTGMLITAATSANASLNNGSAIEASAKAYVSELFGTGVQYIRYLNATLRNSVAPCYAPWAAFVGTTSHVCQGIVGSLNAYWFALGWSLLWCLLLVVFMIWLSGYFIKYKEDIPKSPEVTRLREIVTTPTTMGTINEQEMARTSRMYSYSAGPMEQGHEYVNVMEQGHGYVNASFPEEAEVLHNEAVRETDAAQLNTPGEPPAVTITDEGEAEINQSLVTVNSRKLYDRRTQSFVYTNKFTMADLEREKKRLTPPPDYFTMYPRETSLDGSGPRTVVHQEETETVEYENTW